MQVFKFGGASVKDAASVKNVSNIIKKFEPKEILIVVSAMGKTTNALEKVAYAYYKNQSNSLELLEEVRNYHYEICKGLFDDPQHMIYDMLHNKFIEVEWILEDEATESYDYIYDQIVGVGEFLSTMIVSQYLLKVGIKNVWMDVRDLIRTDNNYREGNVDIDITTKQISKINEALKNNIVITQGFLGGTSENYLTTLGREGSDYSAAIFSNILNVEKMIVWKDVPGVMNADPRVFSFAKLLKKISYQEAIEMTYYGASVIHPKTIKPLQNKKIPLYVRSFINFDAENTIIGDFENIPYPEIVMLKKDQVLASITTNDFSFMNEKNLSVIYQIFTQNKTRINTSQKSAMSFSACFDKDIMKTSALIDELKKHYTVKVNDDMELLTIRHYDDKIVTELTTGKQIYLEQITRNTIQIAMK